MSTKNVERVRPITSTEHERAANEAHPEIGAELHDQEYHSTSDQKRIFRKHVYVGGPVDHGTVASSAEMVALGGTAGAGGSVVAGSAPRGVWPGDTCWRSDENIEYRCTSGNNSTAIWRAVLDLSTVAPAEHTHTADDLPATMPPSAHTHGVSDITGLQAALDALAPRASPALTGAPTAPTPNANDSSNRIATTAMVAAAVAAGGSGASAPTSDAMIAGAAPLAWYKANAGTEVSDGVAASDTDTIQFWRDQSGHGYDLSQGTAGTRPTFRTGIRAGLPVVRFGATGLWMLASAVPSFGLMDCTVVLVFAASSSASNGILVVGASGAGNSYAVNTRLGFTVGNTSESRVSGTGSATVIASTPGAATPPWGVRVLRIAAGVGNAKTNDKVNGSGATVTTLTASETGLLLGTWYNSTPQATATFLGDIAEVVVFGRSVGDSQLGMIASLLASKWAT